jgi:3-oxoacyl-[acyl-carrier protein] reductase
MKTQSHKILYASFGIASALLVGLPTLATIHSTDAPKEKAELQQMPLAEQASYSATKAANVNLAVSLAKELAGTGVTSNVVSPGPILTEGFKELALARAAQEGWEPDLVAIEKRWATEIVPNPTGRMGRPEDVADAVVFLASSRAGFINGANLRVDGGTVPTIN